MSTLGFILIASGFTLVALAMRRHAAIVPSWPVARHRSVRAAGGLLLILALVPCLGAWPPKIGWVAWVGMLTIGALAAVLIVTGLSAAKEKRPHR